MSDESGLNGYMSWTNWLLVFSFVGLISQLLHWNPILSFSASFVGMVPLATILGKATEDIAEHTNETIGALVNVTFGNAVELILSILAMRAGKVSLIKDTIIGSILSNLLLVLGSSFFAGGLIFKEQEACKAVCENNATMHLLAVFGLAIPSLFEISVLETARKESSNERLSLVTALVLVSMYLMFMIFQLHTHADLYQTVTSPPPNTPTTTMSEVSKVLSTSRSRAQHPLDDCGLNLNYVSTSTAVANRNNSMGSIRDSGNTFNGCRNGAIVQPPFLPTTNEPLSTASNLNPPGSLKLAVSILFITVISVTVSSHVLTSTIDEFSTRIGLGQKFIAIVLLPLIANAVEHMSAIMVARHNKIDMSIGIGCGSSLQMALFVAPLMVVLSWVLGYTRICINFDVFETICLGLSVLLVNATLRDSRTNWLKGALLLMSYIVIVVAALLIN